MKRLIVIALVVAVIAIAVNDTARYLMAYYGVDEVTRASAATAAQLARSSNGDRNGPGLAAENYATEHGVHVNGYDQANGVVTVWTDAPVTGTIAYGALVNAMSGVPFKDWWKKMPRISGKASAYTTM